MDPIPLELEYRLRFGDRVVWWGRPVRPALAGRRDLALLPVIAIAAATAAVVAFGPGPTWHPVVTAIFRLGFAASGVALIATHLTIVVRQRRRRFYAITADRVLLARDFWSGGFRAVPLERITDATVDARPSGEGTVTLRVDDGTWPQFVHVADAPGAGAALMAARADFLGRLPGSVPLEIAEILQPDERVLWWGRPKQGLDVFGRTRMRGIFIVGPIAIVLWSGMAWHEGGVAPTVFAAILSLVVLGVAIAVASIDAGLRFNTLYAITDRRVLVLGWEWRHGRRTFALSFTDLRYHPSVTVRATGQGTIHFTLDRPRQRGLADEPTPRFDRIADVRAVLAIFVAAGEAARQRAPGDMGTG